jgi:hypothetical protein
MRLHFTLQSQTQASEFSVGAPALPGPVLPANAKVPLHGVAVDHAAESQHVSRFGSKNDVTHVHRSLDPSRLVRSFEMPRERTAVLYQAYRVGTCFSIVAPGVNDPVAGHVHGRALLRELLGNGVAQGQQKESKEGQELPIVLHKNPPVSDIAGRKLLRLHPAVRGIVLVDGFHGLR